MTLPNPDEDEALNRRIRAAADMPFDEATMTRSVLGRIRNKRRPAARYGGWIGWAAPAAFASVLVATTFVVAVWPVSEDDLLLSLAIGDPRAILGGIVE